MGVSSILDRILNSKKEEVAALKRRSSIGGLERQAQDLGPARDLIAALQPDGRARIIAEIKKASPSAGSLAATLAVDDQARAYQRGGASALSVLTDGPFFSGSLGDLTMARATVDLPVLRKDFIIDPVQVYESRAAGADALLLIVAALSPAQLEDLYRTARELGMTALIEVHNESELASALSLNPRIVGINNRNLATLAVSLETCVRMRPLIPPGPLVVAESGINGPDDIRRLQQAGLDVFLVGTTLMRAPDPAAELARLCRVEA